MHQKSDEQGRVSLANAKENAKSERTLARTPKNAKMTNIDDEFVQDLEIRPASRRKS